MTLLRCRAAGASAGAGAGGGEGGEGGEGPRQKARRALRAAGSAVRTGAAATGGPPLRRPRSASSSGSGASSGSSASAGASGRAPAIGSVSAARSGPSKGPQGFEHLLNQFRDYVFGRANVKAKRSETQREQALARDAVARGQIQPLDAIMRNVRNTVHGELLSARLQRGQRRRLDLQARHSLRQRALPPSRRRRREKRHPRNHEMTE